MRRWRNLTLAGLAFTLAIAGFAAPATAAGAVTARATLAGCTDPDITGSATLIEQPKETTAEEGVKIVTISLMVHGLPPGKHAVHIHEVGSCTPCAAAGGHFDPGPAGNSSPDGNHPFHLGDLTNLDVHSPAASMITITSRVTLSPGPLSLFDANGSALIVHVDPDTYCPDGPVAGCAGGARAACGIIELDD